ncbi:MAG: hypothetical protein J7M05_12340 [Anaerolineae bacterium]|nr:hypothetical protein [Anaerolineae bacterium]
MIFWVCRMTLGVAALLLLFSFVFAGRHRGDRLFLLVGCFLGGLGLGLFGPARGRFPLSSWPLMVGLVGLAMGVWEGILSPNVRRWVPILALLALGVGSFLPGKEIPWRIFWVALVLACLQSALVVGFFLWLPFHPSAWRQGRVVMGLALFLATGAMLSWGWGAQLAWGVWWSWDVQECWHLLGWLIVASLVQATERWRWPRLHLRGLALSGGALLLGVWVASPYLLRALAVSSAYWLP